MNIYLDIDGVLIGDSLANNGKPAKYALELLQAATSKHKCFWLTTHCHGGENRAAEYLEKRFPESKFYLDKILPTDWGTWKTDAIDFKQDFIWLDNNLMAAEKQALEQNDCLQKFILIDLSANPNQLQSVNKQLEQAIKQ